MELPGLVTAEASVVEADILVVGGGPAGVAAATAAARGQSGALRVVLLDNSPTLGGQVWRVSTVEQHTVNEPRRKALAALVASSATHYAGWRVVDAPAKGTLFAYRENSLPSRHGVAPGTLSPEQQYATFHYKQLILATGARERFLPFPGWTLPGVFGAGGLQAIVKGGYKVVGKRIVVAGTGPLLLSVAAHLAECGGQVVCLAEQAPLKRLAPLAASLWSQPGKLLQGMRYRRALTQASLLTGCWVTEALKAPDEHWLGAVRLSDGKRTWEEPCDLLASGFHLVPSTELAVLLGCAMKDGFVQVDAEQRCSVPGVFCAGEPTGIAGLGASLIEGEIAGLAAAGRLAEAGMLMRRSRQEQAFGRKLDGAFALRAELRTLATPETIVCRCEDVRLGQIAGCHGWTEAKLQTRCGMGPCQGRICGPAVEAIFGWPLESVRPPLFPLPVAAWCDSSAQEEIP